MNTLNLKLQNTYKDLPEIFFSRVCPTPVPNPEIVLFNDSLSRSLGLDINETKPRIIANTFSGNQLPNDIEPISQAYAGHQFGHFSILGDGRAVVLGEHISRDGQRFDIQFKGSGRTPYSRQGDGKATLTSMLREYIMSEAMSALGIPTTRSLAVISSGEDVYRESQHPGAILTRIASSHIRVGTFQYAAASGDVNNIKALTEYTIKRHFPSLYETESPALSLLKEVRNRQAKLIAEWIRVGFIHGVMNTDNMSISGETIDYGPCAFLDKYDPSIAFSSIDHGKRYAFGNQAGIANWNIARLAESLLPIIHSDKNISLKLAEEAVNDFKTIFEKEWIKVMRKKLLLSNHNSTDPKFIWEFLEMLESSGADYTNSFYALTHDQIQLLPFSHKANFMDWYKRWKNQISNNCTLINNEKLHDMKVNPAYIPRNHIIEEALTTAENEGDISLIKKLLDVIRTPYKKRQDLTEYSSPCPNGLVGYQTFCGT
ncbi:MAG: hypothetical protein CMM30_07205 [Rhodospirillaceae bacterium]|nr:hypothetical protein [Rhodospirillaceae bacterium]|tara:strand:- start:3008 stop:4465 length:1458 start_codon:yes stop_codon:yes gene_type:complete